MRKTILSVVLLTALYCIAVARVEAQGTYVYSQVMYDDTFNEVVGYSSTEVDYYCADDYDAYVEGYLYDDDQLVDYGCDEGYSIAEVYTIASANDGDDYTLNSYHDVIAIYYYEDIEKGPDGCMPCDGCNTDCYYYYDNWWWYDPFGFSFASTGYYGPWWYLYGFGPPSEVENRDEEYLGETSDSLSIRATPDHLQITNDVTQTVQPCDELERNIFFTVVDYRNRAVGNTDVRENAFNGVSTCDNEAPDFTEDCGTAPGGNYGDSLNAGCPNNGDSHCGFHDTNEQHLWCSSHGLVPIAAFDYDVHHDVIVVNGHSGQLPLRWYVRADKSIKIK